MIYPSPNTCGCGMCAPCRQWDWDYSMAEWQRVSEEDSQALGQDPQKTCKRCERTRTLRDFHRSTRHADGRLWICKDCRNADQQKANAADPQRKAAYSRRYQERHPEKVAAQNRKWRAENPEKTRAAEQRRKERHPQKAKARLDLRHAVETGRIIKPDSCEDCGQKFPKAELHGHHSDYSKPLDVEWLCHPCHQALHQRLHESEAFAEETGEGEDFSVEAELLSAPLRPSQEYLEVTENGSLLSRRDEDHMPWAPHMGWKYR